MRYDDGFAAYLNGVEIARRNAPATLAFDSAATASHPDVRAVAAERIDVSFALSQLVAGENVLAIHALDAADGQEDFLIGAELFAVRSETGAPAYFTTPTPGTGNIAGVLGVVADTQFSVDRGFFYEPFQVEISTHTPDAEIRYTTDGSPPTATTGTVYSGPIEVASTTTLRAAAFKPGYLPTNVDSHTYLFPANVLQQSAIFGIDGGGLPPHPSWGHAGDGDWEVDPQIVEHANPDNRLSTSDLRSVPTLSLTLPWEDMFGGGGRGIYMQGEDVERAVSIEQILPDGATGFQTDGSVQIVGGSSTNRWKSDKLSMRLKFTEEFGPTKLNHPIFGPEAAGSFDTIVLDATLNFSWTHPSTGQTDFAKFIQDQHVANLQLALGGYAPHARYHHLYINGLYWGMYYVHERPDDSFAATYLGGDKDDYDIVKHQADNVVSGSAVNYHAMLALARRNLAIDANYEALAAQLDIGDFIDYMLVNFYVGNTDWAHQNWYASFNRVDPDGKWRFHSWDAEKGHIDVDDDVTGKDNVGGPTEIHQQLRANDEYRLLFADHVQRHFFHDGALSPENAAASYQALMDEIDRAVVGESARWGDNRVSNPYTRDDWLGVQDDLLNDYFPTRTSVVFNQLRDDRLVPSAALAAPEFLIEAGPQHGGQVQIGDDLSFSHPTDDVYFTLDGADPRLPGGAIADSAQIASSAVTIEESALVRARLRAANGQWSALNEAYFTVAPFASRDSLAITEIHYHPAEPTSAELAINAGLTSGDFEFLELMNVSEWPISLAGVQLVAGVELRLPFAADTIIGSGDRVVLVSNRDAFEMRYGADRPIVGQYAGRLDNGGERLRLRDHRGDLLFDFTYADRGDWPAAADGVGASLVLAELGGEYNDGRSWTYSREYGGSPGIGGATTANVFINEVLSSASGGGADLIELFNPTAAAVDVGGWGLSDQSGNLLRGVLPQGVVIGPGEYRTFAEEQFGFGLDADAGDQLWLVETDAKAGAPLRFADVVEFAGAEEDVSLGRWPNGGGHTTLISMEYPTFGAANSGPVANAVRMTEIFYN
ncbi:MAG: chitobiase/beta-hexosaminidase C-terminal domain-containing protein, partial [Planctomycetota bacterium]